MTAIRKAFRPAELPVLAACGSGVPMSFGAFAGRRQTSETLPQSKPELTVVTVVTVATSRFAAITSIRLTTHHPDDI